MARSRARSSGPLDGIGRAARAGSGGGRFDRSPAHRPRGGRRPRLGPFFEEYLVPGAKAFVPRRWPTAQQAVDLIHGAGGVAVVAHPYWDVSARRQVRDLVVSLRNDVGLD